MQATPTCALPTPRSRSSRPGGSATSAASTPRFDPDAMAEALRQSIASHRSTPAGTPRGTASPRPSDLEQAAEVDFFCLQLLNN